MRGHYGRCGFVSILTAGARPGSADRCAGGQDALGDGPLRAEGGQCLGAPGLPAIGRELLPNLTGALTVVATLEMAHAILLESTLSFLGLGVQPPTPSWGLMVAEGKAYMFFQPWVIVIPGLVLALLVLAINLVGDGIRDLTAPDGRN